MNTNELTSIVADYLSTKLYQSGRRSLNAHEQKILQREGQKEFLRAQVLTRKYRKQAADSTAQERITEAIDLAVAGNKPLRFLHTMGGYKVWRVPSRSEVDWADFFNIAYLLQYLSGIAAGYAPGVSLTYYLYTLLPERHNNLTAAEITSYVDSFTALVDEFRPYLPDNLSLSIVRDTDLYTRDEYFTLLDENRVVVRDLFDRLSWRDELVAQAHRNIKWDGAEDWRGLSEAEKQEKVLSSALTELAGIALRRQAEFISAPENVLLFVTARRENGFLGVGSTKSSVAKHWVGTGLIEYWRETLRDKILSPTQWEAVATFPKIKCPVDLFEHRYRNLCEVAVVPERLDFHK